MAKELLAVRLVLDARPEDVAWQLEKALLKGEPGYVLQERLPLPEPAHVEWHEFLRPDCSFSMEKLRQGAEPLDRSTCLFSACVA